MQLKILHLNIWTGKFLNEVIEYIKTHDFDIIQMQEVDNLITSQMKSFQVLSSALSEKYNGEQAITMRFTNRPDSYFSNATFYKKDFNLKDKKIIWLREYKEIPQMEGEVIEDFSRNAISLLLEKDGQEFYTINTHLTWGQTPDDKPYKMEQAKKLYSHIESLTKPFVLTGDFNLEPSTQIVTMFNKLATNLTKKYKLTNTLNAYTHRVQKLFPPGIACDYIYLSKEIKENEFNVIDSPHLSDHLGLSATLEL